jgi:hypothetical protein
MKAKGKPPREVLRPPALTYAAWKAQAVTTLEGPSTMREREWVRLHIQGKTPEEAAAHARTYSYNRQVTASRKRR